MQIVLALTDFLDELFPKYKASGHDINVLKEELTRYYTVGPYRPSIEVYNDVVIVNLDTPPNPQEEKTYGKAVDLCNKGNWPEAKKVLTDLLTQSPNNSEYHRMLGQAYSEDGDQEEAIVN